MNARALAIAILAEVIGTRAPKAPERFTRLRPTALVLFRQRLEAAGVPGIALIIGGVVVLNLFSRAGAR